MRIILAVAFLLSVLRAYAADAAPKYATPAMVNSAASNLVVVISGDNVTISKTSTNGTNFYKVTSTGGTSLLTSNAGVVNLTTFTNHVSIGTNVGLVNASLYDFGSGGDGDGIVRFDHFAVGSSLAQGFVIFYEEGGAGYTGDFSAAESLGNYVKNTGGTAAVLTGGLATYGLDSISTIENSGVQIKGAVCAVQGYGGGDQSYHVGVSGVATSSTANSTNVGSAGTVVKTVVSSIDVGLFGAIYKGSELSVPLSTVSSALLLDNMGNAAIPLIVARTNNGDRQFWVDADGGVTTTNGVTVRRGLTSYDTNATITVLSTGITNTTGRNYRLFGLTGISVLQTNQTRGVGFSRGTITAPTDLVLQPNEFVAGSSIAVQGSQAF